MLCKQAKINFICILQFNQKTTESILNAFLIDSKMCCMKSAPPFRPPHQRRHTTDACVCAYVMYQYQYRRHFILFATKFAHLQKPLKSSSSGKNTLKLSLEKPLPLRPLSLPVSLALCSLPGILFAWWKISFRMLYRFISHTYTRSLYGCLQIVCILSSAHCMHKVACLFCRCTYTVLASERWGGGVRGVRC